MDIKLITKEHIGQEISVEGWVKSNRHSGKVGFISLFDGSTFSGIQVVYKNMEELSPLTTGSALKIKGRVVESKGNQNLEIQTSEILFSNKVEEDYPIQKKTTSLEFLREVAHVRARSNTISAIMKVRSELAFAIHSFYNHEGFYYVHTPIITSNDCEGAGEAFVVTTDKGNEDFNNEFFKQKSLLTVSGQLHGESYAQAFKKIYTFGPTFRSEHSHTSRHAAEFWMIEPEIAFCGIKGITEHGEALVKYTIKHILKNCREEMEFFQKHYDKDLIKRLEKITNSEFRYMTYTKIVKELEKAISQGVKFEDPNIFFGMDFGSEHEKYICEKVVDGPVFATHYPAVIKSFYMKESENKELVDSFDMLVPGIGELIGGSARENNFDVLMEKAKKAGVDPKTIKWYLDLRRFGSAESAGFGLGFERLIMYITGISNIRDVIPFPRTPDSIEF